jgi:inosine-uridine nucleoside N-ribohydrolase
VLGVTVEFGNTSQRKAYAKAREIVELMGRGHVPVLKGSEFPRAEPSEASRFIVEQARRYPGRVKILAVGALTNLAAAIQEDPAVVNLLEEVVTVGGNLRADDRLPGEDFPYDLNYGSDPECARIVFSSGLAITLVSIELCRQFLLEWSRFRGATRRGDPVDRYLRRSTVSWFIAGAGRTVAWDVVGLSFVVHPEWFTHAQARVLFRVFQAGRPWVTLQIADDGPCLTTLLTEVENQSRFWEWLEVSL